MIKDFLFNLLFTVIFLFLIALFAMPVVLPIVLVAVCNASPLWFLLCMLYIPYIAIIVTVAERCE